MILVLLGTQNNSFNRLLKKIEELIENGIIKEKVIVQAGYTKYQPKNENMEIFDFISQEQLGKYQDEADLIITHGGVGSIITSLKKSKKIIAVPRLHEYKEHVNDHQKQLVELFAKRKYLIGLKSVEELEDAITKIKDFTPVPYKGEEKGRDNIIKIIEDFISQLS